jgi:peptidoglycan/LPS O-acetylase OafA/YrhL
MPASSVSEDKLAFIDALRGVAILAVIAYHVGIELRDRNIYAPPVFKGGQYGVQLFYVASAFTLCLSHHRRRREPRALGRFFVRRYFRIAPTYYAGLLFYFLIRGWHQGVWPPAGYDTASILTNLTFTHGWHPSTINHVVPGGWSIACEMMFYGLLPLVLIWVRSWPTALAWFGLSLLINLGAGLLSQQPISAAWHQQNPEFFYYWLPNQLPVFAAGMLAYFVLEKIELCSSEAQRRFRMAAWLAFVVVALAAAVVLFSRSLGVYTHVVIAPVCGICFSFLLIAQALGPTPLLVNSLTRKFGVYSYGGYISHFACLWLLFTPAIPPLLNQQHPAITWTVYTVAVAGLTLVAAAIVHRLIEQPGIDLGRQVIRRWLTPT